MKPKKYYTTKELKADLMKNPAFKREYARLEPHFQIASQMISARIKKKMTQAQLAERVGTGQAVISRLEGMKARPSISLLERVASALKTKLTVTIG